MAMIRITVQYDAYNRIFLIRDAEMAQVLQDGGIYQLDVPLSVDATSDLDELLLAGAPIAHA